MKPLNTWTPDEVLKGCALLGATFAFLLGLWQYRRAQQWKRAEWVAQEFKALQGEPLVQAVQLMIDWGARNVRLYPHRERPEEQYVWLDDDQTARALMPHEMRVGDPFTPLEADIRNAFDMWLDGIERFNAYVATDLVSVEDLGPYLKYWASQICREHATDGSEDRLIRLGEYMRRYGYQGAFDLLSRVAKS